MDRNKPEEAVVCMTILSAIIIYQKSKNINMLLRWYCQNPPSAKYLYLFLPMCVFLTFLLCSICIGGSAMKRCRNFREFVAEGGLRMSDMKDCLSRDLKPRRIKL